MALPAGTKIGVYKIIGAIGAGGMGEVYRAHDTKLRRDVAIKVLAPFMANDPDHLARFAREARLLAALNHPRIATIHGFDEADGVHALAMELVEGPTLAEKLRGSRSNPRTGLPLAETLKIAGQLAEAIEAAHGKGVIHRDLKPANIKLGLDGNVKVLDFGVAKAFSSEHSGDNAPPTITVTEFQAGRIVGTPAYLSPEQARGHAIDKQTDIWAFGCVLYEMLTGRLAFPGETISDSIAAILERQPDWDAVPAQTPASIRRLLRRCLDKDPNRRLHDIADARIEIDDIQTGRQDEGQLAALPPSPRRWPVWASAVVPLALLAIAAGVWPRGTLTVPEELRLEINTPPGVDQSLAISPDGRTLVFVATSAGHRQLWSRPLDSPVATPLAGTERASLPFWSPDGRSIGFFADVALKRMAIDGGSVKTLSSDIAVALGGTWNRDGTILFANNPGGPILRTSTEGADPVAVTRIGLPQQRGHAWPRFLPDDRHFLFFVSGTPDSRGVYVGQLDSPASKRLFDADTSAVYTAGHLLFVREGHLLAQSFDPDRLELKGSPFSIADNVTGRTAVSASTAGPIVYRTGPAELGQRQLVWVDRTGREIDNVVYQDSAALGPALSPDGRRILVSRFANENMDVWSYETRRRAWDRVTFDPGDDIFALWSPDGASIVFGAVRQSDQSGPNGTINLYRMSLSGSRSETLLFSGPDPSFPMDWSADGRFLLFVILNPKRSFDIWALPLEGDRKPFEVVQTEFSEGLPVFSPDGQWIAYESNKTGRSEIYLRPFRGPATDSRASTEGGSQVRWNRNGKELFYIGADGRLMAEPIRFSPDGKSVEFGTALGLFSTTVGNAPTNVYRQQYVVSSDGQSFVMNSVLGEGKASPIGVILNWKPAR